MLLFIQLTLLCILGGHEDLDNVELRAAVATLKNEQQDGTVCLLWHETE